MNALHHSPLGASANATLMETIMQPLSYARRTARWLMAAGLALAAMQTAPATAQPAPDLVPGLNLERGGGPGRDPDRPDRPGRGEAEPSFEKVGRQLNCDYVVYQLRFGAQGDPEKFADPDFTANLQNVRMDFRDTLPAGLEIVDVQVSGDGTDAGGGPLPAATVSTTTNPNDTAKLEDFRISTSDLDGSGEADRRYVDIVITAKIDHAAFPAPTIVANQGFVTINLEGGGSIEVASHNPALPDDGDFATGEPTEITIDVTRCDRPPPPPPGDREECFKVETGEVDCVPGGGAFIYHMPVGPELGGKWVQLRTTTPGVTVAPLSQLVPIGGGVLNWTITGALPGDIVHLIVSGIDIYAGPEEGLGLCCSQQIDIVIPEDLECPPGEPDIQILKKADDEFCTPEGPCDFTITVKNVGDAPYNGPIVLDEVTLPGNAPVVSGPNGAWVCVPMASPMTCTHPATTLDPGEEIELKLGFAPGPGWDWNFIGNCAAFDYPASGWEHTFGRTDNDRACARIPICRRGDPRCDPPTEKKVDLRINKDPRGVQCSLDGVCWFNIQVYNNGDDLYVGPLTVIDEYPTGVPASSTFGPNPPWNCGPIGGGQFQCDHPGLALPPGAFIPLWVRAVVPGDYGDFIRNCAKVNAIPGETDLANNRDCAELRVPNRQPGRPDLQIEKTCEGPSDIGEPATCRITVRNDGTAAPTGPVRVHDAAEVIGSPAPVQILTVTPDGAEWACGPVPANTLSCQIPGAVMTPGTSRHFDVTVQVPTYGRFENCARGNWGPAPGNDIVYPFGEACAEGGSLPQPVNVEKTGDKECQVGEPCTFEITITNGGTEAFSGPVRIGDAIGVGGTRLEGVEITEISPPFGCSPEPTTLPMSCVATLTLGPGESRVHQVTVVIPEGGPLANIREPVEARNCVAVVPPDTPVARIEGGMAAAPETTGRPGTQPFACHTFTIADQVQECSPGFVMNDAGRCVCPEGTTFRNGQCRPTGGEPPPPPPPPPEVEECKLLPGQIRTESGRCICPRGTELLKGRCVKDEPPPVQCKLLPGQIRLENGRCVCPRGTELRNGRCRKVEVQCKLLPGQIRLEDGRCVCPRGTSLVRGECRKDQVQCKLLPGQIRLEDGRCVCPRGTRLIRGECRKPQVEQCKLLPGMIRLENGRCVCPRGTSLVRGECRKDQVECPKGTVLIRGKCVERQRECPKGTVLRDGRCVTIERERCPRGTIGTPPNCRRLQISPDLQQLLQPRQPSNNIKGGQ